MRSVLSRRASGRRRVWPSWLVLALAPFACAPLPEARVPAAAAPAAASGAALTGQPAAAPWRIDDDPDRALLASVYSFPSTLIAGDEAAALLRAVRGADPRRELLVLVDEAQRQQLAPLAKGLGARLLVARGGPYSPWPRDPLSFARTGAGAVRLIVRPNLQPGREADAGLGRELAEGLPADLDRAWGGVRWERAEVPFHNGQVLLTGEAAWVTLHTFEPRALQLLGVGRVPVESFASAAGIDAYLGAVASAAAELGALYGRPIRFVHPLPTAASGLALPARAEILRRLGGGAGLDLDSLVTLVPARGGRGAALVADLGLGEQLGAAAPTVEWRDFAAAWGLAPAVDVAAALVDAARSERGRELTAFLDLVAAHLAAEGFDVHRLPLLAVPLGLLRDPGGMSHDHFLVTWNNVVVERRADGVRAEGFAALFPSADRQATATFGAAGARLDLLPPLRGSVLRNGGYRCASNHLRAKG